VHPVCVESVAWISEQKNTLSTFFYLLSALVYLRSRRPRAGIAPAGNTPGADVPRGTAGDAALPLAKGPSPGAYALSTLLFALALMSKSVTASLPAALLVVVWWKNGRLSWRRDVLPLVPWFAMAVGFGLVTAWFERRMMEIEHVTVALTLGQRLLLAGRVLGFYLGKLFWPTDLIFMYPKWNVSVAVWWQYLFPAGVAALLVLLWLRPFATLGKWGRGPLAGFLFFAGTLFPALGFLNAFPFRYTYVADHFQYLASLGVFAAAAGGWGEWVRGRPVRLAAGVPLAVLCVLGVLSFRQAGTYRDLETVYRTTIDRNPGCWMVRTNLGALLLEKGNPKEAEAQLRESLKDNPGLAETHYDLANALLAEGRLGDAIPEYEKAHDLNPNVVEIEMNLGNALYKAGRVIEASAHFSRALQLQPEGNYLALHNLAATLCAIGRYPQAIERYRAALLLAPSLPDAHYSLGLALDQAGGFDEAVSEFQKALQLGPDDPEVRTNLGIALANAGRLADSIPQFEAAVRLAPGNAGYHYNLGTALRAAGRVLEATEQLTRAAQLDPKAYGGRR
jgi:tetratricopeptide (TPR) repeat protein